MSQFSSTTLQWRAAFASALLIFGGAFLGVCADRLWLLAFSANEADPQVSVEALSTALNLNIRQRDEIAALMDSIGWSITEAIEQNPESLPTVARESRARLEQAIPDDRRPRFRNWMDGRRSEMLDRMRSRGMMSGGRGRGRGPMADSAPRGTGRGRMRPN